MARTYRARGTSPTVAKKWVEGPLRGAHWNLRSKIAGIIAHSFYNFPCVLKGRPVLSVHTDTHDRGSPSKPKGWKPVVLPPSLAKLVANVKPKKRNPQLHYRTINVHSHEECLYQRLSYKLVKDIIDRAIKLHGPAPVSSIDHHPYVRSGDRRKHGRRNPRHTKYSDKKSKRRQEHVEVTESLKTDEIWPRED